MGSLRVGEPAAKERRLRQHGQSLNHRETIVCSLRRGDDPFSDRLHRRVVVPEAVDPAELVVGEQCAGSNTRLVEERTRLFAHSFRSIQIRHPPSEEIRETEFHHRPGCRIDGAEKDAFDRAAWL